jgi:hypothetical protein
MGLLYLGTPLPWAEAKKYADHVRHHGITQFLHIWDRLKDRTGDELLWGDEVCIYATLQLTPADIIQDRVFSYIAGRKGEERETLPPSDGDLGQAQRFC